MKAVFKTSSSNKNAYDSVDTLVIDVSWVAKRHEHALGQRFHTSDGRMSGHVYGAFKDLGSVLAALRPRRVAFCYDRGYQWRLDLAPSYKSSRRTPEGEEKPWFPGLDVERFFRCFPGLHLAADDFEADDMIGYFVQKWKHEGPVAIYSKDRDLWQLVDDEKKVACVFPQRGAAWREKSKRLWICEDQVRERFGVSPKAVAKVKALMGDPSDQIKGLQGAKRPGKQDALRAFAETASSDDYFDPTIKSPVLEAPDWLVDPLWEERDRILANYQITSIPYAVSKVAVDPIVKGDGDLAGALDVLAEFECNSLMAQIDPLFRRYFS